MSIKEKRHPHEEIEQEGGRNTLPLKVKYTEVEIKKGSPLKRKASHFQISYRLM